MKTPTNPGTAADVGLPSGACSADFALLGLLADVRAAAGDPHGKLMQDELVARIRSTAFALVRLHHAVTVRMSADEPTGEQRLELLKAWEEAGRLIVPNV